MNREIKFRAWHPKENKWLWPYPEGFHIIGEITVFNMLSGQVKCEDMNVVEIMQFTGLKDKNGVDIYEGDIVRFDWSGKADIFQNWINCTVEWGCFGIASFYLKSITEQPAVYSNSGYSYDALSERVAQFAETIGNIYQNPELLNETHN